VRSVLKVCAFPHPGRKLAESSQLKGSWPRNDAEVLKALSSPVWDWSLFRLHGLWSLLVPWPLPWLLFIFKPFRHHFKSGSNRQWWTRSNIATTIAVCWSIAGTLLQRLNPEGFSALDAHWDVWLNILLFQAAVPAGILVMLPEASFLRLTLKQDASMVAQYVVPYLWAFPWCLLGASVAMCHHVGITKIAGELYPWQLSASIVVFAMVSFYQALLVTFRGYAFGLYLVGREKGSSS